jgi:hypothetical protein
LDIPASVEFPGSYFIGAIIDPVNVFKETNEEDNEALAEVALAAITPPEVPPAAIPVNVFIDKVELDRSLISLKPVEFEEGLGVQNSDAGGTLFLGAQGSEVPIEAETFAWLRLTRSDRQGATHDVPLYLWNTTAERYTNAYGVDTSSPPCSPFDPTCTPSDVPVEWLSIGEIEPQLIEIDEAADQPVYNDPDRKAVHLDLYMPGRLAVELDANIRALNRFLSDPSFPPPDLASEDIFALQSFLFGLPNNFSDPENPNDPGPALEVLSADICVEIRPVNSGIETVADRFAEDNQECTPVAFVFPPLPPPRPVPIPPPPEVLPPLYSTDRNKVFFSQSFGDDFGGNYIGIALRFNAESSVDENGFIAAASGEVPINVFGARVQFMDARGRLQLIPAYKDAPQDQASELSFVLSFAGQQIFNKTEPINTGVNFFGELIPVPLFEQEKKVTRTFYPGGVPVTVEGTLGGTIGAKYTMDFRANALPLNASLDLTADTFAILRAKASALAGVGGVVSFGAILDIKELLGEHYIVTAGADLDTRRDGFQDGIVEMVFTPRFEIRNEINAGAGTFTVYAEFPFPVGIRFCGFWRIPCGLRYRQIREDIVLDRFTAYRKVDDLLNLSTDISVVIYPDGTVAYYGP